MDKKAKAEAKRARRTQRKLGVDENESQERTDVDIEGSDVDAETTDGESQPPSAEPNTPDATT